MGSSSASQLAWNTPNSAVRRFSSFDTTFVAPEKAGRRRISATWACSVSPGPTTGMPPSLREGGATSGCRRVGSRLATGPPRRVAATFAISPSLRSSFVDQGS